MLTLEHTQVREAATGLIARGVAAMVVELRQVSGSVPREAGTRMVVTADTVIGTIGGGHLEWKAIASARERLQARAGPATIAAPETPPFPGGSGAMGHAPAPPSSEGSGLADEERYPLGPALGQCCGGVAVVGYRRLDEVTLADWPPAPERFHLQLHGAGHVGRAVVHVLQAVPCRVQWIDEREAQDFPGEDADAGDAALPPHITRHTSEAAESEVASAPPGAHYLVMTHRHDLDQRIGEAILKRGDFAYFGLIGSRSKRERFARRWAERGIDPSLIARVACPIGLPGIGGKEPGLIAVSVVAQMLAASGSPPQPRRSSSPAATG